MFYSVKELIQSAKESRREAWELILMDDANERNVSQKESFEKNALYVALYEKIR